MYDAIVDEREQWVKLLTDELNPEVTECQRPARVVLRPWVDPKVLQAEILIEEQGYGSQITVLLHAEKPGLAQDERKWVRYRLGTLFGAALRSWVDDGYVE